MPGLALFALIHGAITLISKHLDGNKTKAGLGVVAVGGVLPVLSVFGVDVTPEGTVDVFNQVLGLFGHHIVADAQQTAQTLLGSLFTLIGGSVAMYGYFRKGQLVSK